jgi:DNA-binding response OmpR family regulator
VSSRILLADATPELDDSIEAVLRRACFETERVSDGEAALNAVSRGPIDLVLLDLDL